ncbi:hypothetical protein B7P43_G16680 [Cryptotermes secundus]|uniref:Tc1-like transposase DDE domain-containing protein n=1 Tax=Cryptotermes secundus TaxID=105785 RepID=A0A2J7QUN3_9NEOP|nr:hypothetical protein B7P43_G16680 [Cryptotermes secundus]
MEAYSPECLVPAVVQAAVSMYAGTVQLWFEEHEGELQHPPWPAQAPDLNITEPLWSVLETRMSNKVPPSTSLKQLEVVLHEKCYNILLETAQNL